MTTVTVHLDEELLKEAQAIANSRHTSFDDVVADALKQATASQKQSFATDSSSEERQQRFDATLAKLRHFHFTAPFTRDEMNER